MGLSVDESNDLARLIDDVIARDRLASRGIEAGLDLPSDLWAPEAGEAALRVMLDALFDNAAVLLVDGGSIHVTARNFEAGSRGEHPGCPPGHYVLLRPGPRRSLHRACGG